MGSVAEIRSDRTQIWRRHRFSPDSPRRNWATLPSALRRAITRRAKWFSAKESRAPVCTWLSVGMFAFSKPQPPAASRCSPSTAPVVRWRRSRYSMATPILLRAPPWTMSRCCLSVSRISRRCAWPIRRWRSRCFAWWARLRRLVGIIEELSFTTVRHRLVSLLFRLAQREGRQTAEGLEFSLPASHQELAAQIGTVRELVSRNLSRLQAEGLLKMEGRTVVVRDLKLLAAELEGGE